MVELLEKVIARAKLLPAGEQNELAGIIEEYLADPAGYYEITDEEEKLVQVGLDQANRGQFATPEQVRKAFDSYRK
jgi:predicted transcriptional regulator